MADLNLRHRLIAVALASGHSAADIARELNMSQSYISILKRDPEFQLLADSYSTRVIDDSLKIRSMSLAQMQERINADAEKAYERVVEISLSGTGRVPLAANLAIMDRASNVPKIVQRAETQQVTKIVLELPAVENILKAAKESELTELLEVANQELYGPNTRVYDGSETPIDAEFIPSPSSPASPVAPQPLLSLDDAISRLSSPAEEVEDGGLS